MDILSAALNQYLENHASEENEILQALNRETHLKVLRPRMLSGHLQGRLLALLSKMLRPQNILEIGTYTGYSALCLVEGLQEGGHLHTIDRNEEIADIAQKYFHKAGYQAQITLHIGNAREIIPNLNLEFDLVFIDADKESYGIYYDLAFDKLRPGGCIIIDNVLWSGKVFSESSKTDKKQKAIESFNKKVQCDERVENVILPLRDGLMLAYKK